MNTRKATVSVNIPSGYMNEILDERVRSGYTYYNLIAQALNLYDSDKDGFNRVYNERMLIGDKDQSSGKVSFRLYTDIIDWCKDLAKEENLSLSGFIRKLLIVRAQYAKKPEDPLFNPNYIYDSFTHLDDNPFNEDDSLSERISIQMTSVEYASVIWLTDELGLTPSEFLRFSVNYRLYWMIEADYDFILNIDFRPERRSQMTHRMTFCITKGMKDDLKKIAEHENKTITEVVNEGICLSFDRYEKEKMSEVEEDGDDLCEDETFVPV